MNINQSPISNQEHLFESIEESFKVIENTMLSEKDAQHLSNQLINSPTVVSRTADWLIKHTSNFDSISIFDEGKIIGFITVDIYDVNYHNNKIHERIGLRTDPIHRGKNIGKYLMLKLTEKINNRPIASYTPNEKVGHISKKYLGFEEVLQKDISPQVIKILELGGPLDGKGYKFFMNKKLLELMSQDQFTSKQ